jgi:hypothetical protein
MEVHAHTHMARKKWTHYFWEFLMLFLAVFCGFLAENQREHMIEHRREKRYAIQLLADLRADSVELSSWINRVSRRRTESTQKLRKLLTQQPPATDKEIIQAMYTITRSDLRLKNTTFNEMRSSGTLRYIHNDLIKESLSVYYDILSPRVISSWGEARNFYNEYIIPFKLKHVRSQDIDIDDNTDSLLIQNPVMIERTAKTDQELLNYVNSYYSQMNWSLINNKCKPALRQIEKLIPMLKKEYHLK